ncbi:MAG: tRNA pseudouridine(55) synthase TruB [Clostridia bacterium]|nr:tRNA pseudouridine(55) synthase TruB [Clostridia bacterium]
MKGFINYYKPSGISSAYAINRIKKLFKGEKIGHMGTLDPLAEGVLPIAIGKATRLFDYLLDKDKVYVATFTFGYETDTLDRGGKVIKSGGKVPTESEVLKVIPSLIGTVMQVPPAYSAKNVQGKRSYELARQGIEVELKPKKVEISQIKLINYNGDSFNFEITCKGGTYIRSIVRDMALALNTFGTMTALKRVKSGAFSVENAVYEEEIVESDLEDLLIAPDSVLSLESIYLNDELYIELENGRPCIATCENGLYKVYHDEEFIGVGLVENAILKIKARIK